MRRLLAAGVFLSLIALAVYLPGVLTAPVTARTTEISNSGFMTPGLTGFASSWIASSLPQLSGWWGNFTPVPLLYIAWFLPLVMLIDLAKLRKISRQLLSLFAVGVGSLGLALAPSDMGPLRFPARLIPYLVLCVLVFLAVVLTKARLARLNRMRVFSIFFMVVAGAYLAWAQDPSVRSHFRFMGLVLVGLGIVLWLMFAFKRRFSWLNSKIALVSFLTLISLVTVSAQRYYFPVTPLTDFSLPSQVADYAKPLKKAKGMTFIAGNPADLGPEVWNETLVANAWYLNGTPVQNLYTTIMYAKYAEEFCQDSRGWTCQEAADTLFSVDPTTGKLLVDLLSIDSVQLIREASDLDGSELASKMPPPGWYVADRTTNTVLWVRDQPVLNTGDQVWSSDGTVLRTVSHESGKLVLRVESVGSNGSVVLSRLDWPGYTITNAEEASPLRGYLLRLNVSEDSVGKEITVEFEPPGWKVVVGSMIAALIIALGWIALGCVKRFRKQKPATAKAEQQLVRDP